MEARRRAVAAALVAFACTFIVALASRNWYLAAGTPHAAARRTPQIKNFVIDLSHGKRSCFLDLEDAEESKQLAQLVAGADVFSLGRLVPPICIYPYIYITIILHPLPLTIQSIQYLLLY